MTQHEADIPQPQADEILVLCYRSRALIEGDLRSPDCPVRALGEHSARRNAATGVTGALLFRDGQFAQTLEGPRAAVVELYAKILRDPRHTDVTKAWSEVRSERAFPHWSMWLIDLEHHDFQWLAGADLAPGEGFNAHAVHDLRAMRMLVSLG